MKTVKISVVIILLFAGAVFAAFISSEKTVFNRMDNGFAVVELFTSEGCSSCPPADALVAKIEKENADKPVYILAFHVDYWNRLGWKDQFSSADFSKRQSEYAHYLKLQSIYTPQIVVNGKTEFVGSDEGTLRKAIDISLKKKSEAEINLAITRLDKKQADLKYMVEGSITNTVLQVAIVKKAATSNVKSGENEGRTLSHVQIVRKLQQVPLSSNAGTVNIALPQGFNPADWEITGLLQNRANGSIIAAATAATAATVARGVL